MYFSPLTEAEKREMLNKVGCDSTASLFSDIPKTIQRDDVPLAKGVTEMEALEQLNELASPGNSSFSLAGAGSYRHYIPSPVDHLSSRSEFYTAYTPYQPEVSQGTLTAIFEFQTMICNLTGLDVANASLYDGATAAVEALLMVLSKKRKSEAAVSSLLHPYYKEVLQTYCWANDITLHWIEEESGVTSQKSLDAIMCNNIGAVMVQSPNFFGNIETLSAFSPEKLFPEAKKAPFNLIEVVTEPFSLALLKSGKEVGVSVVCGEASAFGNPQGFGGPGLGFLAVESSFMRSIPGRLVGQSVDLDGKIAYSLTLQTREQHIRREKATSNICSNEGLCALRAAIFLSLIGKQLLPVAKLNRDLAYSLREQLIGVGFSADYDVPIFNEWLMSVPNASAFLDLALESGIEGGVLILKLDSNFADNKVLFCATELTSPNQIKKIVAIANEHMRVNS